MWVYTTILFSDQCDANKIKRCQCSGSAVGAAWNIYHHRLNICQTSQNMHTENYFNFNFKINLLENILAWPLPELHNKLNYKCNGLCFLILKKIFLQQSYILKQKIFCLTKIYLVS